VLASSATIKCKALEDKRRGLGEKSNPTSLQYAVIITHVKYSK
jgi:hypothetical protein